MENGVSRNIPPWNIQPWTFLSGNFRSWDFISRKILAFLAALSHTPLADWFASHIRNDSSNWNFSMIFAYMVEHTPTFLQNFSVCKLVASEKSYGRSNICHFPAFQARIPGWRLFTLSSENLANIGGLG